jgi:glycosyltransferase involved in cell wall biosynthesis
MRILVISNLYPSPAHPAFGTFVEARVEALRALGVEVRVAAIHDPAVHRRVAAKYASLAWAAGRAALASRVVGPRFDVVETHIAYPTGLIGRPLAALAGAPLVLFAHGADVMDVPARSAWHAWLARSTFRSAALIVANSRFLAREIVAGDPALADRVRILTPGIELERFTADETAPVRRAGVLFVGRLVKRKGADVLVEAMAAIDGAARRLTIVGDGPEATPLAALAGQIGVELDLRGDIGRDEVAATMHRAAVVVVPSVYREPLGLVAIEAMAAGAIVVVSATGGLTESVEDGVTGLTVPPGNHAALTDAIEHALAIADDPVAGPAMRAAARSTAETHDVGRAAAASLGWYGTLRR